MSVHRDISDVRDVEQLINCFYMKALSDDVLIFSFIKVDWNTHLKSIYAAWSSLILSNDEAHIHDLKDFDLPLDYRHAERWLALFTETVNENFRGDVAEDVKRKARAIVTSCFCRLN